MDSLIAWSLGGGSDELLAAIGRMTLYFTAMDECITEAIRGYIDENPPLITILGDLPLARMPTANFTKKQAWLISILEQMDNDTPRHAEVLNLVRESGSLNVERRDYTHGLIRLTKGKLVFCNKGHSLPAARIGDLNDRLYAWLCTFMGMYLSHSLFVYFNAKTQQNRLGRKSLPE